MRQRYGDRRAFNAPARPYESNGDQAGSEAKLGVGSRNSLRPPISMVKSEGPAFPPGSRKNMITRPLGAKVGPSLWKPSVRTRSPLPSGFITPMANLPSDWRVKAM